MTFISRQGIPVQAYILGTPFTGNDQQIFKLTIDCLIEPSLVQAVTHIVRRHDEVSLVSSTPELTPAGSLLYL
jgi:hypothetical protein